MPNLTPLALELLEGKNFATIATLMPDGSPQASVVWVETDGTHVVFNTAEGRAKPRNLRRDPRCAVAVIDSANPYRQAMIRGRVVEITPAGGDEMIERLSKKYLGKPYPFRQPGEKRLVVKILPEHVSTMG